MRFGHRGKKVVVDGEEFGSQLKAAQLTGVPYQAIRSCCLCPYNGGASGCKTDMKCPNKIKGWAYSHVKDAV